MREDKLYAIRLRKAGKSFPEIQAEIGIPKSTLSGWLKDIKLTRKQRAVLDKNSREALKRARVYAVKIHNKQKAERINQAQEIAFMDLKNIDLTNPYILKLALALLYLGEGFKTNTTGMGNSDPRILKFFIQSLITLYGLTRDNFTCELHLRADQNGPDMVQYWSQELQISSDKFKSSMFDKRTLGSITYSHYKGVCIVHVGKIAIQRELMFLSTIFCDRVIQHKGG